MLDFYDSKQMVGQVSVRSMPRELNAGLVDAALETIPQVSSVDIERAKALALAQNLTLDRSILHLGLVEEDVLLKALANETGLEYEPTSTQLSLHLGTLTELGREYVRRLNFAPIDRTPDHCVLLTNDPMNQQLLEELAFHLDVALTLVLCPSWEIRALLERGEASLTSQDQTLSHDQLARDLLTYEKGTSDGPVIEFVAEKLSEAVSVGASDVHFEAAENGLTVRFRKSGYLKMQPVPRQISASNVFARLKVMADLNVSERRLPQDGRIRTVIGGRMIDFRLSTLPTQFGESLVCRVLDPKSLTRGWSDLGFSPEITSKILDVLKQPSGLFLVTGPTGSGKTTTLYTALQTLNSVDTKIITIEDPVEYNLEGVQQVEVNEATGLTFAKGLRSILRQDPNVIMVGEIRDGETAEIACRAAMVGRLVLATLHTSEAAMAVNRLVDLGVPRFVIEDVLVGVLGQRLVSSEVGESQLVAEIT